MLFGWKHLQETQQGYLEHSFFAFKWGFFLIGTGIVSIVHGIFPGLWKFKASQNVMKVAKMLEKRNNPNEMNPPK